MNSIYVWWYYFAVRRGKSNPTRFYFLVNVLRIYITWFTFFISIFLIGDHSSIWPLPIRLEKLYFSAAFSYPLIITTKTNTLQPLYKKRCFPLKSSLESVCKTTINYRFVTVYWRSTCKKTLLFSRVRSNHPEVFCKKGALGNFAKFTRKPLCQSLLRPKILLKKRLAQVFSYEFCEISKNIFLYRTPLVVASIELVMKKFRKKEISQNQFLTQIVWEFSKLIFNADSMKSSSLNYYKFFLQRNP